MGCVWAEVPEFLVGADAAVALVQRHYYNSVSYVNTLRTVDFRLAKITRRCSKIPARRIAAPHPCASPPATQAAKSAADDATVWSLWGGCLLWPRLTRPHRGVQVRGGRAAGGGELRPTLREKPGGKPAFPKENRHT